MTVGRAPGLVPGHPICWPVRTCRRGPPDPLTYTYSGSVPHGTSRHASGQFIAIQQGKEVPATRLLNPPNKITVEVLMSVYIRI